MRKLFMLPYSVPEDVTLEFDGKLGRGKVYMIGIEVTMEVDAEIHLTQERPELDLLDSPLCDSVGSGEQTLIDRVWKPMTEEELRDISGNISL